MDILKKSVSGRPRDLAKGISILKAARNLFLKYGYEGTSIDAIAAEAGVSKNTVYRNFIDKEALFAAVVEAPYDGDRLPSTLFDLAEDASISQKLYEIAKRHQDLIENQESLELYRLMAILIMKAPEHIELFYDIDHRATLHQMRRLLQQAHKQGKLNVTNVAIAAEYFLSAFNGGMQFRKVFGVKEVIFTDMGEEIREEYMREVVKRFVLAYAA